MNTTRNNAIKAVRIRSDKHRIKPVRRRESEETEYIKVLYRVVVALGGAAIVLAAGFIYLM